MPRQSIDVVGTGDTLPGAFTKLNSMTEELYGTVIVNHTTTPVTLTGDMGKVHTNRGGSALQVWNLPAGAANLRMIAQRVPAYEIRLEPSGSEIIGDGGAGKYLSIQSRGTVVLEWQTDRWEVLGGSALYNYEA